MVSIRWCRKQMKGLKVITPSTKMSDSYLRMAESTLNSLKTGELSRIWAAAKIYYAFYYSLYSVMLRIGITSEIHACSIEFMKRFLVPPYTRQDVQMMKMAFTNRNNL